MVVSGIEFIFPLTMVRREEEKVEGEKENGEGLILKMFYLHLWLIPFLVPAIVGMDCEWVGRKKMLSFAMFLLGKNK
jgi:hypothetical protein